MCLHIHRYIQYTYMYVYSFSVFFKMSRNTETFPSEAYNNNNNFFKRTFLAVTRLTHRLFFTIFPLFHLIPHIYH